MKSSGIIDTLGRTTSKSTCTQIIAVAPGKMIELKIIQLSVDCNKGKVFIMCQLPLTVNNNDNSCAFHNNRFNVLYISAPVTGPIAFLFNLSPIGGSEYTTSIQFSS